MKRYDIAYKILSLIITYTGIMYLFLLCKQVCLNIMHIPISLIPFSIPKLKEFKNHQSHEEQRQERQERRDEYRKDKPNDEDVRIENIWHEILGVSQNAHFEEIASAYKRLIISYHPDKFKHLGPDFEIVANKRAKNINAAYDYAKKLHGKS